MVVDSGNYGVVVFFGLVAGSCHVFALVVDLLMHC